ncbi:MAG TPA: DUF4407 domain-containing protein [Bacteroidia bacterium]|nr:DUF4407 domain-containing protein [Bacteroidia bacterium]
MLKFSSKITGDDYNMLVNDTPTSKKKVMMFANALFLPVILWFLTGYGMATQIFHMSAFNGIIAGSIAGFVVFLIDRSIILADCCGTISVIRLLLGFFVATIGSVIIDEIVFKEDIDHHLAQTLEVKVDAERKKVESDFAARIVEAQQKSDVAFQDWQRGVQDVKAESDGTYGTGKYGSGKVTALKSLLADKQYAEFQNRNADMVKLQQLSDSEKDSSEQLVRASFGEGMLLNRIKATFELVFSDWAMGIMYFIFTGLLMMVEFLVVLLKMKHPESNYDRKVKMIEKIGEARMKKIAAADQRWYDGGQSLPGTQKLTNHLRINPPTFLN